MVLVVHSTANPIDVDTRHIRSLMLSAGLDVVGVEYQWDNEVAFRRMENRHVPVDQQRVIESDPQQTEKSLDNLWGFIALSVREHPELLEHDEVADAWRETWDALVELNWKIQRARAIEDLERAKADVARAERELKNLDRP
jgi:hypothetical protein